MRSLSRRRHATFAIVLVGVLLVLRLPFLAAGVDDLDSTNFHAGVIDYSPPAHRPHPPGFPVFMAAAKVVATMAGTPLAALTLISALAGALASVPLFLIARRLMGVVAARYAAILGAFVPIAWFVSVRPMSDAFGWCVGLSALAALVYGIDRRRPYADRWWIAGAAISGVAIGVRLQLSVLVLPLFFVGTVWRRREPLAGPAVLAAAVLGWWMPMVRASGGLAAYAAAFERTMTDAARWEPLLSRPSIARAIDGLQHVLIGPWQSAALAVPLLVIAVIGLARGIRRRPRSIGLLAVMFLPYAAFNYLVQNTEAVRYAIPALPLVALSAAYGVTAVRGLHRTAAPAIVGVYVAVSAAITLPALVEYRGQLSPPVRALRDIPREPGREVVVSGSGVFDRYSAFGPRSFRLLSPSGGEGWSRVAQYWARGGEAPVHFLLMPGESLRGLVDPEAIEDAGRWQWSPRVLPFMAGERPNEVHRIRIQRPAWFVPGVRSVRGHQPELSVFVRSDTERHVIVQGRGDLAAQTFSLHVGRTLRDRQDDTRSFLLRADVPESAAYTELKVRSLASFQLSRVVTVHAAEARLQPIKGLRRAKSEEGAFHWLAPQATLMAHVPSGGAMLHLEGQVPSAALAPDAELTVRWNDEAVAATALSAASFAISVALRPAMDAWSALTLETTRDGRPVEFDLQVTDISIDGWFAGLGDLP